MSSSMYELAEAIEAERLSDAASKRNGLSDIDDDVVNSGFGVVELSSTSRAVVFRCSSQGSRSSSSSNIIVPAGGRETAFVLKIEPFGNDS